MQLAAQFDEVFDAGQEHLGVEGFGDVVVGSGFKALEHVFFGGFGGEEDDGDVTGGDVFFQGVAELVAVEFGHHDVADDQVGDLFEGFGEALFAIYRFNDCVLGLERFSDVMSHIIVVFHHQDDGLFLGCVKIFLFGHVYFPLAAGGWLGRDEVEMAGFGSGSFGWNVDDLVGF